MFSFSRKSRNKELEELVRKVRLEAENNYKDAAQEAFQKFSLRLEEMERDGSLKKSVLSFYQEQKNELEEMPRGVHH